MFLTTPNGSESKSKAYLIAITSRLKSKSFLTPPLFIFIFNFHVISFLKLINQLNILFYEIYNYK